MKRRLAQIEASLDRYFEQLERPIARSSGIWLSSMSIAVPPTSV